MSLYAVHVDMRPDSFVQLPAFWVIVYAAWPRGAPPAGLPPSWCICWLLRAIWGLLWGFRHTNSFCAALESLTRVHTPCTRDLTWRGYSTDTQYCKRTPSVSVSTCDMRQIRNAFTLYGHTTSRCQEQLFWQTAPRRRPRACGAGPRRAGLQAQAPYVLQQPRREQLAAAAKQRVRQHARHLFKQTAARACTCAAGQDARGTRVAERA